MTTEELKEKVKELGYVYEENEHAIQILKESVEWKSEECCLIENKRIEIAIVSKIVQGRTEIINAHDDVTLMTQIVLYAATPIEERDSKRYFQYRLKPIADWQSQSSDLEFLNYRKSKKFWVLGGSEQTGEWQTIFEESDPLLDGVHLEMFEAIEVGKKGNELHD